jgi:hypothetical protein
VHGAKIIAVDYAVSVAFRIEVAAEKTEAFRAAAVETTRGRIRFEIPSP